MELTLEMVVLVVLARVVFATLYALITGMGLAMAGSW